MAQPCRDPLNIEKERERQRERVRETERERVRRRRKETSGEVKHLGQHVFPNSIYQFNTS